MAMGVGVGDEYEVFQKGRIVEVSFEEAGLRGSWYTATVIRSNSPKTNKMLVEYHSLMAEEEQGSKPLREFVDSILVRPIPPRDSNPHFQLMDDVDAFHNDGWWEGVVTQILQPGSTYSVFFRCSREQIDFSLSDLRLHREWIRGHHWDPPLDPPSPSNSPPGYKKKKGEDKEERRNGNQSGDKDDVKANGVERDVGRRRRRNVASKKDGVGNNRGERRGSDCSSNKDTVAKKRKEREQKTTTIGMCNKGGGTRNGKVKQPRRRAKGRQQSKK